MMYHNKDQRAGESRVDLRDHSYGRLFANVISEGLTKGLIKPDKYYVICEHKSFFQANHLPQHIVNCLNGPERGILIQWARHVQLINYNDVQFKVKRLSDGEQVLDTAWITPLSMNYARESVERVTGAFNAMSAIKDELVKCGGAPILMGQTAWMMLEDEANLLYRVMPPFATEKDVYYIDITESDVRVSSFDDDVVSVSHEREDLIKGSRVDGTTLAIFIGMTAALAQRIDFGSGSINSRYRLHSATGGVDWTMTKAFGPRYFNHTELRLG